VQGQQLAKPAPKAVRRHSKIVYWSIYLRMPGTKLSVYSFTGKKKEDSFTYLLKKCKIYSTGNKNCLREE